MNLVFNEQAKTMNVSNSHSGPVAGPIIAVPIVAAPMAPPAPTPVVSASTAASVAPAQAGAVAPAPPPAPAAASGGPSTTQTQCGECGRIITGKLQFRLHSEKHVRDKVKRERGAYKCPQCGRGFVTEKTCRQHVDMTHNKIGGCKCHVCGRVFGSEHNLRQHVATHANMGAFRCALCTRTFSSDHNRRQHQATHSTNGPYNADEKAEGEMFPCKICDRLFGNDFNRKQHELTHQRRRKNSSHGQAPPQHKDMPLMQNNIISSGAIMSAAAEKQDNSVVITHTTHNPSASILKCQYCTQGFIDQNELFHHEEIHKKLGHIGTANLAASQTLLPSQTSCKYAGTTDNRGNHSSNNAQDMKPLICHQCGLLCATEVAMIEHVKQHETLNKLYQSQQQQPQQQQTQSQSQSQVVNSSQQQQQQQQQQRQQQQPQQQQQQVSQVRNDRSPSDGGSITVSSPPADNSNNAPSSTTTHNTTTPGNMSVFPMPQISPGLPSMLDELCLAATTWNTFYTQQQQPGNLTSSTVAVPQLPKALVAHSTINQNHLPNGNSMMLPPGQQQPQDILPVKPKKKKKKKKPKVRLDEIFECSICHQTFATEFHRNIHANSHKYYDGSRGNKSQASLSSVTAAAAEIAKAAVHNTSTTTTSISSNTNATNTVVTNNMSNSAPTNNNNNNSNPATPHSGTENIHNTNTSTTTCSYNNIGMVDTSGAYVPSSYGMTAAVAPSTAGMSTYGMTTVPNAFQTAASLPTMVPMATPNQYPVTMAMAAPAPHPIFPLIHRPASNTLSAPVAHHPVAQQPLFPQPLPQPVFPQR